MSKVFALGALEQAFKDWYWTTGSEMPDIGILVIGLSRDGCDLQYMGIDPHAVIDWPSLFSRIIEEIQSGRYSIHGKAEVKFSSQM
jgi:hypothetical protein